MDRFELTYLINIVVGYYLYEKRLVHQEGKTIDISYKDVKDDIIKVEIFMYILSNLFGNDVKSRIGNDEYNIALSEVKSDDKSRCGDHECSISLVTSCTLDQYLDNIASSFRALPPTLVETGMQTGRLLGQLILYFSIYKNSKTHDEGVKNFIRYIDLTTDLICHAIGVLDQARHYGLRDRDDGEILKNITCIQLMDIQYFEEAEGKDNLQPNEVIILIDKTKLAALLNVPEKGIPSNSLYVNCNNETLKYIIEHDEHYKYAKDKIIVEIINKEQLCSEYCVETNSMCTHTTVLKKILNKLRKKDKKEYSEFFTHFKDISKDLKNGVKRIAQRFALKELIAQFPKRGLRKCEKVV